MLVFNNLEEPKMKANRNSNSNTLLAVYTSELGLPCRSKFHIINFPLDTLICIQGFVDPGDIISLRKTCKTIYAATHQRTVWLNALRNVCLTQGVFLPTFPVENMTQASLEHAALNPFRFSSYLQKEHPLISPIKPFVTRVLQPHVPSTSPVAGLPHGTFEKVLLVPGGRFLFTLSSLGIIHLWDLGVTPSTIIKPYPLASMDGRGIDITSLHPTSDGLGIRLITLTTDENSPTIGIEYAVYEIYPTVQSPVFEKIKLLHVERCAVQAEGYAQDLIAFQTINNIVTVWNFMLDSLVSWRVNHDSTSIMLYSGNIILIGGQGFTLWKIPPLKLCSPGTPFELVADQTAVLLFMYPFHRSQAGVTLINYEWLPSSHSDGPAYFSLVGLDEESLSLACYVMKSIDNSHDEDLPNITPMLLNKLRLPSNGDFEVFYGSLYFCDQNLVLPWVVNRRVMVNISQRPTKRGQKVSHKTVLLYTGSSMNHNQYDLCPVSGRLCIAADQEEVRVVDFIMPISPPQHEIYTLRT